MSTRAAAARAMSESVDEVDDHNLLETCRELLVNSVESAPERKTSRVNFCWTEDAEKILINVALKHEAHHETKGSNMDTKWKLVKEELLKDHDRFRTWQDMKWESLKTKFQRMLADVDSKYAISGEGANLSGLPEGGMSDRDKMLVGILESNAEELACKEASKVKKRKRQVK